MGIALVLETFCAGAGGEGSLVATRSEVRSAVVYVRWRSDGLKIRGITRGKRENVGAVIIMVSMGSESELEGVVPEH